MAKRLLYILLSLTLSFAFSANANAFQRIELIEVEQQISIVATGSGVHVVGANGEQMEVYNVAGVRILTMKVDGSDKRFDLNLPKGCYIVKVGKVARKVSLK